jgi:hypothetical protein
MIADMDFTGVLVGLTEIAVALAGFTGVVVFGSHSAGSEPLPPTYGSRVGSTECPLLSITPGLYGL